MFNINRRTFLGWSGAAAATTLATRPSWAQGSGTRSVVLQTSNWSPSGVFGTVLAQLLGYNEEEGIDVTINYGGPNIDGVALVAANRAQIGQFISSPLMMLAVSQGMPIQAFAVGVQEHPYGVIFKKSSGIQTVEDLRGRRVAVHQVGKVNVQALLASAGMTEEDVEIIIMGTDELTPLMTNQADGVGGWVTNPALINGLGDDMGSLRLWDNGIQFYAHVYYSNHETLQNRPDDLAAFTRATARGWQYVHDNPEDAVERLVAAHDQLKRDDELQLQQALRRFLFTSATAEHGWGHMDMAVWESQLKLYQDLGQFTARVPDVAELATLDVLNATADARPKLG